ncbi:MAG: hypothetical protein OEX81_03315 [Candidatus Pacebacteria bacterium]|nr:hypothetical protein [Candidatus Paceibacterota bacterium]
MSGYTWVTNLKDGLILFLIGIILYLIGKYCLGLVGGFGEIVLVICAGEIYLAFLTLVLIAITTMGFIMALSGFSEITKALLRRMIGDRKYYDSLWIITEESKAERL